MKDNVELSRLAMISKRAQGILVGCVNRMGSMMTFFIDRNKINNYGYVQICDRGRFPYFFRKLESIDMLLPSPQFKLIFLTFSHTGEVLYRVVEAFEQATASMVTENG